MAAMHPESITGTFIPFQICHAIGMAKYFGMSSPAAGFVWFISLIMHYLTALGERMAWGLITGHSSNWASSQKALKSQAGAPLVSLFTWWVLINVLPSPQWMFGDKGCLASPLPTLTPCGNQWLLAGQRLVPLLWRWTSAVSLQSTISNQAAHWLNRHKTTLAKLSPCPVSVFGH